MREIPAIVLGEGITLLGTIRCLGRVGITSFCFGRSSVDEAHSRYYKKLVEKNDSELKEGELEKILEQTAFAKAVLIPCSDHWLHQVANLPAHIKTRFPGCENNAETLSLFTDKARFRDLLQKHNIPSPKTFDEASAITTDADFFLKPRDSQRFSFVFKKKGIGVKTAE